MSAKLWQVDVSERPPNRDARRIITLVHKKGIGASIPAHLGLTVSSQDSAASRKGSTGRCPHNPRRS